MARTQTGLYYDAEAAQMRRRDRDMIPRKLILACATIALAALTMVGFAALTDRPTVGQPHSAAVLAQRSLVLSGDGSAVTITTPEGQVIHDTENGAFIAVVIDGLERARTVHRTPGNPPVTLTRFANGRLQLVDSATGWSTELASFGADNLALWDVAFAAAE
ncbi:photosynthetic complex assembly protein [Rhodobacteraceae bacterium CCMM004]|nr:photosynthetic complex assembly protein [Rhodobacteraceae bacterium CCMM004]